MTWTTEALDAAQQQAREAVVDEDWIYDGEDERRVTFVNEAAFDAALELAAARAAWEEADSCREHPDAYAAARLRAALQAIP